MFRFRPVFLPLVALLTACGSDAPLSESDFEAAVRAAPIPAEHAAGEAVFQANCATCHGQRALGTDRGPPLVHIIYEPSHHGDIAFVLAAERGVRAHHWNFGDMPPVPSITREEVMQVTAYVRYLQRVVGIQ
jgi:mono/diheme cytochrome c family protein